MIVVEGVWRMETELNQGSLWQGKGGSGASRVFLGEGEKKWRFRIKNKADAADRDSIDFPYE